MKSKILLITYSILFLLPAYSNDKISDEEKEVDTTYYDSITPYFPYIAGTLITAGTALFFYSQHQALNHHPQGQGVHPQNLGNVLGGVAAGVVAHFESGCMLDATASLKKATHHERIEKLSLSTKLRITIETLQKRFPTIPVSMLIRAERLRTIKSEKELDFFIDKLISFVSMIGTSKIIWIKHWHRMLVPTEDPEADNSLLLFPKIMTANDHVFELPEFFKLMIMFAAPENNNPKAYGTLHLMRDFIRALPGAITHQEGYTLVDHLES